MTAPKTRGAAIAAHCRGCTHDPCATGTWREQVAVCQNTACPLWAFRPLPANAPGWIKCRDPASLPDGFIGLHHDDAIRTLRGNIDAKAAYAPETGPRLTVQHGGATGVAGAMP